MGGVDSSSPSESCQINGWVHKSSFWDKRSTAICMDPAVHAWTIASFVSASDPFRTAASAQCPMIDTWIMFSSSLIPMPAGESSGCTVLFLNVNSNESTALYLGGMNMRINHGRNNVDTSRFRISTQIISIASQLNSRGNPSILEY